MLTSLPRGHATSKLITGEPWWTGESQVRWPSPAFPLQTLSAQDLWAEPRASCFAFSQTPLISCLDTFRPGLTQELRDEDAFVIWPSSSHEQLLVLCFLWLECCYQRKETYRDFPAAQSIAGDFDIIVVAASFLLQWTQEVVG